MTALKHPFFLLDKTITSFGKDRVAGMEACEQLLSIHDLPPNIEAAGRRNQSWYLDRLDSLPGARQMTTDFRPPEGWQAMNPSIAYHTELGLAAIVRTVNYRIDPDGRYLIDDPGGVIRTRNWLVPVDERRGIRFDTGAEIDVGVYHLQAPPFPVAGDEDCRLIPLPTGWAYSATRRDVDAEGWAVMTYSPITDGAVWFRTQLSEGGTHNKNWMPVLKEPFGNRWVDRCSPTVVRNFSHPATATIPAPHIARHFSGGSQLIPWNEGWLAVIHEAVNHEGRPPRTYQHRLVQFSANFAITHLTDPFCFHGRGIEFCAGLTTHPGDGDFIFSYGIGDKDIRLLKVPVESLAPLMRLPYGEEVTL